MSLVAIFRLTPVIGLAFSNLQAHEGHDLPIGTGTVVTTATEMGSGDHRYITIPGWGALPDGEILGSMHGDLAIDKAGNVYASRESEVGISVFDRKGRFLKNLKPGLQQCHSLAIVEEDGKEYLWGAQYQANRAVKFDLEGNIIETLPNEKTGELDGGMGGLTNVTVLPDGHILFCMGYGSSKIHKLKADGTHVKTFGGWGKGEKQFRTCHNATVDRRYGEPRLLVCDRENRRMVHLTTDLEWIGLYGEEGMRRPADVDIRGELAAVGELEGRVILMDKEGKVVATLGDNANKKEWATNKVPAANLNDSAFSAPHGVKWGSHGELYVTEWSLVGRIVALHPIK